jgi:hypothetical protein
VSRLPTKAQLAALEQALRDLDDPQVNGDPDPRFHEVVPYELLVAGGGWGKHGGLFAEAAHGVKLNKQIRKERAADDVRAARVVQ